MAVHVWSKDDDYLGQVYKADGRLSISAENEGLNKALEAILAHPPMTDTGGFEIRFGNMPSRYLEFPDEDWLDVAAALYLPPAGFRVHVIAGPERDDRL